MIENREKFNLNESLLKIGNSLSISGVVFSDINSSVIFMFPDNELHENIITPSLSIDDWKKILKQTDIQEVEVLADDGHGLKKAIIRKSGRQIDNKISWRVFKRDQYKCRYCGRDDVPLTVDHLVLWEEGGPSTEENLVSACSKCNKTRGNMQYIDWINSEQYISKISGVEVEFQMLNNFLVDSLKDIPRRAHIISRGNKKKKTRNGNSTRMDIEKMR